MNKKLVQVEVEGKKRVGGFNKKKLAAFVECATSINTNGNEVFDKERFAELIVGECIAGVLLAEIRMSGYMASIIENRVGCKENYYNDKWFIDNWQTDKA